MVNISEMQGQPFNFGGPNEPEQRLAIAATSEDGRIQQGVWDCGPGELHLDFAWDETVYGLEGRVECEEVDSGTKVTLVPGSLATFRRGSRWIWRIPWKFRKVFTIIDSSV